MHTDEAVNAYILGEALAGKGFQYDPKDRHGPALAALALPLARIQGAKSFADLTESELRLADVLAGTVTILLFGVAAESFGFLPCIVAALLFAVGPLPVYYDRYFIHESLFVAATFGLILSAGRACRSGSLGQGALAGLCAALMLACKETAVLHFVALSAATLCSRYWNLRGVYPGNARSRAGAVAGAGAFLLVSLMLFSWFGNNWSSLFALAHSVPHLLARAGGEGHDKPFWYYGQLLAGGWSGGILCVLAGGALLRPIRVRVASPYDFLVFYAMFLAGIYSVIPYKTPWLALNLFLPVALLAGLSVEYLWQVKAPLCMLACTVAAVAIGHDTRQRVFVHPADETNPYAYAHTSEDLLGLAPAMQQMAAETGLMSSRVAVIAVDPWPLPWYLRKFSQTGFWQPGQDPGDADFYITDTAAADGYKDRLKDFHADFFGLRPGVLILLWSPLPK